MKFTSEEAVSFRSYKAIPTPLSGFTARSDARAMSGEEPALSRLSHEQNGQMKSERSRGVITGNPSRARAHVAKSSMAQIPRLRLNGRQHSRRGHRQQQSAEKFNGYPKVHESVRHSVAKTLRRLSEHTFDQRKRVLAYRGAAHLDVRDRVSMKIDRLSQVPNHPIERGIRPCVAARGTKVYPRQR
jgi:hypothetical protein